MKRFATIQAMFLVGAVLLQISIAAAQDEPTSSTEAAAIDESAAPFTPPVLLRTVEATYPPEAVEQQIEAEVILEIDIDATGQVEGVVVAVPAEPAGLGFDEAAVEAASQFEFTPAKEGDTPVPARITYRYRFTLDGVVAPEEESAESDPPAQTGPPEQPVEPAEPVLSFRGELVERGTRLPIVGETVTVFRGDGEEAVGFEATTDENGEFLFYDLAPGFWRLLAEPEGYFPLRIEEEITAQVLTEARYFLEKGDYNPYDVLVEGQQTRREVNRTSLAIEEVEKIPGAAGDVLAVVKNLPGVARTGPLSGNIIVRGSSPEDTEVFVDEVNVPIIYHFGGTRSVIPLGMLDQIDFYPGNFSTRYGRATGGIVDVRLKRLNPEKVGGYLDVNLFDSGAYIEAPLGDKAAIAVAGRRSYVDTFLDLLVPDDAGVNLVTAPRYYDYQLLLNLRPSSAHEISAFVFGSDDELRLLFDNPANFNPEIRANDASTSTRFYRTVLKYEFAPNEMVTNTFRATSGRNWIYFGLGEQLFLDIESYTAQLRDVLTLKFNDALTLLGGVDYLFNRADVSIKFPQASKEGEQGGRPDLDTLRFTESSEDFQSIAGFFEVQATLWDRLLIIPGIRADYFSQVDQTSFAPRLTLRYQLNDQWTLKGGIGRFFQEPSFDETDDVFGNPQLGLESAWHYSAGVEYRPLPHLTLDITGFYKDLDDLVSRTSETSNEDGEIVPLNFDNRGEGRVYGLEVLFRHDLSNNFTGWLSYTLSRAERKDGGADDYRLFDFDQTHILTLLGTYYLPRNWSIGMRWRLVSGNPYTPRGGSVYVVDDGIYEAFLGEPNSERLPPFHQLDLRIDKRWVFENWMFTAYLDLQNVYNRANPVGRTYNYDSSETGVQQSLPLIPIIGIKGEF